MGYLIYVLIKILTPLLLITIYGNTKHSFLPLYSDAICAQVDNHIAISYNLYFSINVEVYMTILKVNIMFSNWF